MSKTVWMIRFADLGVLEDEPEGGCQQQHERDEGQIAKKLTLHSRAVATIVDKL